MKDCTWEPIENLENILDMVEEFERNLKPKKKVKKSIKVYSYKYY